MQISNTEGVGVSYCSWQTQIKLLTCSSMCAHLHAAYGMCAVVCVCVCELSSASVGPVCVCMLFITTFLTDSSCQTNVPLC